MGSLASTARVTQLLRLLPGPMLRTLDAWSHRRALRKQLERQEAWLRRQAPRQ